MKRGLPYERRATAGQPQLLQLGRGSFHKQKGLSYSGTTILSCGSKQGRGSPGEEDKKALKEPFTGCGVPAYYRTAEILANGEAVSEQGSQTVRNGARLDVAAWGNEPIERKKTTALPRPDVLSCSGSDQEPLAWGAKYSSVGGEGEFRNEVRAREGGWRAVCRKLKF